jgi:5-methylcytosine-specific restriction endonuclease McrA
MNRRARWRYNLETMKRYADHQLRWRVYSRDRGQCQYCGIEVSFEECNIDHVVPWPKGLTVFSNLVVACRGCNKLKGGVRIPNKLLPTRKRTAEERAAAQLFRANRHLFTH